MSKLLTDDILQALRDIGITQDMATQRWAFRGKHSVFYNMKTNKFVVPSTADKDDKRIRLVTSLEIKQTVEITYGHMHSNVQNVLHKMISDLGVLRSTMNLLVDAQYDDSRFGGVVTQEEFDYAKYRFVDRYLRMVQQVEGRMLEIDDTMGIISSLCTNLTVDVGLGNDSLRKIKKAKWPDTMVYLYFLYHTLVHSLEDDDATVEQMMKVRTQADVDKLMEAAMSMYQ